jgi:PTH1 family peptidyl-tRNA hydrolase
MVVDQMADRFRVRLDRVAHGAQLGEIAVAGARILLMKPQTYMNLSGEAVASVARYYRVSTGAFVAVYDELDLPLGRIRIRRDGGAGGHRGVKSMITRLGDAGFVRVRVGIGRPPAGCEAADFVLSSFTSSEMAAMNAAIDRAADALEALIAEGVEGAMSRFNGQGERERTSNRSRGERVAGSANRGLPVADTGGRTT